MVFLPLPRGAERGIKYQQYLSLKRRAMLDSLNRDLLTSFKVDPKDDVSAQFGLLKGEGYGVKRQSRRGSRAEEYHPQPRQIQQENPPSQMIQATNPTPTKAVPSQFLFDDGGVHGDCHDSVRASAAPAFGGGGFPALPDRYAGAEHVYAVGTGDVLCVYPASFNLSRYLHTEAGMICRYPKAEVMKHALRI